MANLICKLTGVRGRSMEVYDNKCIIKTEVTAGSFLTSNATDGEKTIFYIDCTGIQFKKSGLAIGYLQIETPSMQMNNQNSNFFSENTFTFEEGKNNVTNELMYAVYQFISDRVEGYKYGTNIQPLTQPTGKLAQLLGTNRTNSFLNAAPKSTGATGDSWVCDSCGTKNSVVRFCRGCGLRRF